MTDERLIALAEELGALLDARRFKVTTAESCTAGLVSAAITAIPGSSDWFEYGFVVYANAAKSAILGVPPPMLREHGAVSETVARAMAGGALSRSGADVALAVTGIAGPGGGTAAKPVGTVCFAWLFRDGSGASETRQLAGGRADVRRESVVVALEGLIARLRDA